MALSDEDKQWINDRLGRLEDLVVNFKESLESEMHDGFSVMAARLDNSSARLDRHAAYWQTGRRWSGRMEEWAEKIDKSLDVKDRQIMDLTDRLRRLEEGKNGK